MIEKSCDTCASSGRPSYVDPCAGCHTYKNWDEKPITTLNQYQQATARTDSHTNKNDAILNFALGIAGEAGEIVDIVKKMVYHGHVLDKDKMCAELGDLSWYIARMAARYDLTLEEVARGNIDKLKRRYPSGFDKDRSINREG